MKLKRILALVLCFAMVLSTMSFSVSAEETEAAVEIATEDDILVEALAETVETPTIADFDGVSYETLQAAINAAQTAGGDATVTLTSDVTENVTVKEAVGFYLTIDGANMTMDGTITIKALSDTNDNRRTTIQNINFVNTEDGTGFAFIKSNETNHYPRVTVDGCSFTGSGYEDDVDEDVAVNLKSAYDAIIENCTGTGLHSFLQNTSGVGITVENVTVTDSNGGLAMGTAQNVAISGCDITVNNYGIRLDAVLDTDVTLTDNKVNSYIPVSVRKATATDYQLTFDGDDSNYTATNSENVWCAVCATEFEEGVELNAPTGDVKIEYNTDAVTGFGVYGSYTPPVGILEANGTVTAYDTLAKALEAAADGDTIVVNSPDAAIPANGKVVGGKTVTITGNAKFNWRAGWLYVGRDGEGDGKLIFKNANITTDNQSYVESTGIYVSTTEYKNGEDVATKNFGEVEIIDSNIQLAYLRQQHNVTVDNSELCVYGGFSVAGRIAGETESGVDSTATMTIKNNSSVIVKNSNGMGIGYSTDKEGKGIVNLENSSFICEAGSAIGPKATFNIAGNVTVNVPSGEVNATGDVTFEGENKFGIMAIESYNFTIGKDATVAMVDETRPVLGHGATVNIEGNIADAKNVDASTITPSLYIAGGASITGNGVTFNAKDAYVKFGAKNGVSSKNSAAYGKFDFDFENCIVDLTTQQLTLSEPKNGLTPEFNFNFKDSAVTTTNKLCIAADNTEMTLDNTSFETASQFRNDGILTLKNGSYLKATMSQPGENNGNAGTIIVDDSKLDIIMANEHVAMGKAAAGTLTLKNGAEAVVPYIMNTTISTDGTSKLSAAKLISGNTITIDAANLVRGSAVTIIEQTDANATTLEGVATITNAHYVDVSYDNNSITLNGAYMVTTYEELLEALETDNAKIVMMNDITGDAATGTGYGKAGIVLDAGDVLDGNGHKLTINRANGTWDCAVGMTGGEVKNLTITGGFRGIFMPGANGDVVVDNCVLEDVVYTFNSDSGNKNFGVTIKNTDLYGWTSFSDAHKFINFENCTFGEGNGYQFCRPYNAVTFTNCEFEEGYQFDATRTENAFDDCTYDGEPISLDSAAIMFYAGGNVTVDGEPVAFKKVVAVVGEKECYDSLQAAVDACPENGTITIKADGSYTFPNTNGKSFTLKADDDVDAVFELGATKPALGGADITFENITFNWDAHTDYKGLQHNGDMTYNNCTINGKVFLYGTSETFNDCTFNQEVVDYNVWTYSADFVEFNDCTFNSVGKSLLIYHEDADTFTDVAVNNCEFIASAPCDGKAAIEMDSSRTSGIKLIVDDKTTATGFAEGSVSHETLWNVKKVNGTTSVTVADEVVYAHIKGNTQAVASINGTLYASLQEAFDAAVDNDTIDVISNIEYNADNAVVSADGQWKDGIVYKGDKSFTVDLNGYTISDNGELNDYLLYFNNKGNKDNTITLVNGIISGGDNLWTTITVGSKSSTATTTLNLGEGLVVTADGSGRAGYENALIKNRYSSVINVLDGATINSGSDMMYGITVGGYADVKPAVNIYDGAVITNENEKGIAVTGNGILNIEGGTITSEGWAVYTSTSGQAEVTISGGEITGVVGAVASAADLSSYPSAAPVVNISGGYINGQVAVLEWGTSTVSDGAELTICGGTFTEDVTAFCEDGFAAYENADGTYNVCKERTLNIETSVTELYEGETVEVKVVLGGDNIAGTSWTLNWDEEYFKPDDSENLANTGKVNDAAWCVNNEVFDDGQVVMTYKFVAIAQETKVVGAFSLENTCASTRGESLDGTSIVATTDGAAQVTILLHEYGFVKMFDGSETTETEAAVSFDGIPHTFEIAPDAQLPAGITYEITYTVDGETVPAVSLTKEKDTPYIIGYKIDAEKGYADYEGTFEITISKADYKLEVNDYTLNTKLVLVYTNTDALRFKYNNVPMIDVSEARFDATTEELVKYKYNNTDEYKYVYGYVVYGAESDFDHDTVITYTGDSAEVFAIDNAFDYADVNFSKNLNVQDITTAYSVANEYSALYKNIKYQKQLLKADTNGSKNVNGADTGYVVSEVKEALGLR